MGGGGPFRIGVNALYLLPGGVGGTEIYLRHLLAALAAVEAANQYFVFTNRETGSDLIPDAPNFHARPQNIRAVNRAARILFEQFLLPLAVARDSVDVLFNPGFTAPAFATAPNVTVFHDLQHVRHPEHFRRFDLPFWRLMLYTAVERSRFLIAVSEPTKQDMVKHYGLACDRVEVVEHGVDPRFFSLPRQPGPEPYLLCVSTLHPHKNIERLLRVFSRLRKEHPSLRLVLAGMRGFHTQRIEKAIGELDLSSAVAVTGWIPRERLYALYAGATAFVYPSTFEGFGMPVLEAMAARIPLAYSAIPPLEAIAGDTAVAFDPLNEHQMRTAIDVVLSPGPEREGRVTRAFHRAAEYTWEQAARKTLEVLTRAVGRR